MPDRSINDIRSALEALGDRPVMIYDPRRLSDAGIQEMRDITAALGAVPLVTLALHIESLDSLYINLPPDKLKAYAAGYPVVIYPISLVELPAPSRHRPVDTPNITAAKRALELGAYRLTAAQTAVELARNKRNRQLTRAQGEELARRIIAHAVWRGDRDSTSFDRLRFLAGLIDRGRRIAAGFFRLTNPRDVARFESKNVDDKVIGSGQAKLATIDLVEASHVAQATGLADNGLRANLHDRAMRRWSIAMRNGQPISKLDAVEVCNAYIDRMASHDLMTIAITSDLNPADIHRNWELYRAEFELGRLLGRLRRHQSITITAAQAAILLAAFTTYEMQRLKTQKDVCEYLLAVEAFSCHPCRVWVADLTRILDAGQAEIIAPGRPPDPS